MLLQAVRERINRWINVYYSLRPPNVQNMWITLDEWSEIIMTPNWNAACHSSNMTHMRRTWPRAKTERASTWHEWRRSDMWRAGTALLAQHYLRWQDLSLSTSVSGADASVFSLAGCKQWTIWESICACTLTVLVPMKQLWAAAAAAAWLWRQLDEKRTKQKPTWLSVLWWYAWSGWMFFPECLYGSGGGLSPRAHTLPRDAELQLL